jgi:hypothetical protein
MRAFVMGFTAGRGAPPGVFGRDLVLEGESFTARLRERFAAGSHHVFLAPATLAAALAAALRERGSDVGLALEHDRPIASASFAFRVEAFSRPIADELRAVLIKSLPAGVRLQGLSDAEETHPEAHGPEPFAPLHEYVYRASGRITGELEDVLQIWKRAYGRDCTEIGGIRLVVDTANV